MTASSLEWLVLLLVLVGGAAGLWRARELERRIAVLERSLGAFSALGSGGSDEAGDVEILGHLLAINEGLLQEIRTTEPSRKRNEEN